MNKGSLCLVLLLCFLGNRSFAVSPQRATKNLADSSLIELNPHKSMSFQPTSEQGFIVVALQDCSVLIDGQKENLHTGDFRQVKGKRILQLASSSSSPVSLVVITIKSANQDLTITDTVLEHHEALEDASDSNTSLLVAIAPLQIRDVRDQNDEGEPWKPSTPMVIELSAGQTTWLISGMHRLRNLGPYSAHFITIEW